MRQKREKRIRRKMTREDMTFYLILIPFMGTFFIFNILPVLASVTLSFFDFDMVS
ncbi:MAG TPA: ABC transporter permease, partial [Ruminococcaceae bacterium]|nr:ABC transporter permease [Oscillospiraceae bacterium]